MDNNRYIKVSADPIEITKEDITSDFDFYLKMRFPSSLRASGRVKWKTIGWVCFIWAMFILVTWIGVHRMRALKQGFGDNWSVFVLAGLCKVISGHTGAVLWGHYSHDSLGGGGV